MWKKIKKLTDFALVVGFIVFIFVMPLMSCVSHTVLVIKNAREDPVYLPRKIDSLSNKFANFSKKLERALSKRLQGKNNHSNLKDKTAIAKQSQKAVEAVGSTFEISGGLEKRIEGAIQNRLFKKYAFINLNGALARCLGMNSLNERMKLANGFLARFYEVKNIEGTSEKLIALNKFLDDRGIPFIYLLAPYKTSIYDVQFAPGYGDGSKQNITNMINALNAAGVETINMDAWFEENGWHMADVLFKTDHHWKPEAGLAAARCAMELLQKKGIAKYDEEKLLDGSYKKVVLKNWFLGSSGKRTGKYYGGVDDITIFYPKFETDFFYAGLRKDTTDWEFSESVLDLSYAEKKDYFRTSPYSIYMHRDYPLRNTINAKAENNKRLLLMGDSFKMMAEYFLTTQFREVHTIDLRYNTDINFAQHFEETKPDVVVMCINENAIVSEKLNIFGVDEYLTAHEQTDPSSPIQNLGDFELHAEEENNEKFALVCGNLEPDQAYTLTVDRTVLSGVEHSFVQMTLQNLTTNKAIYNRYFESNSDERQKWIFTTPEKTEDAYGIFLYAGTKGHTAGINVKVEGINLRKGIFED